jgi:hypothetical protein
LQAFAQVSEQQQDDAQAHNRNSQPLVASDHQAEAKQLDILLAP